MSTTTINGGLRALTDTEARAVEMFHREDPLDLISVETGLTRAQIAAAVGQARELERQKAEQAAPAAVRPQPVPVAPRPAAPTPKPEPQAKPKTSAPGPDDVQSWEIEDLLSWADQDGGTRPRSLAAKIRLAASDLRDLAGRGEAVRAAEADVAALSAKLAAAKEALRLAQGKKPATATPSTATGPKGETAVIRAWARENGHEVTDRGRIPAPILEAYQRAQS